MTLSDSDAIGVKLWGTRGSVPVSLSADDVGRKIKDALRLWSEAPQDERADVDAFVENRLGFAQRATFGGNSSCVEIFDGAGHQLIMDMGTGLRALSDSLARRKNAHDNKQFHFLMSHLHWDHISGFPFFIPAYVPGHTIHIHGGHEDLEHGIRRQHQAPSFPVPYEALGSEIVYHRLDPGERHEIEGFAVTLAPQHHGGGGSFAYRVEKNGRSVVYATDGEHKIEDRGDFERTASFFADADLVVFDGMYSLADLVTLKQDWGHSSNLIGVDLCHAAGVGKLCLFHHEPAYGDELIQDILDQTRRYEVLSRTDHELEVVAAFDGLVIEV